MNKKKLLALVLAALMSGREHSGSNSECRHYCTVRRGL